MSKNKFQIIAIILISVVISTLLNYIIFNPRSGNTNSRSNPPEIEIPLNQVKSVNLPKTVDFAGEQVPLNLYYVKEHLEWELTVNTYWHSSTLLNLKRTGRWFPVIEPILKANNIPDDFKYFSLIESGF